MREKAGNRAGADALTQQAAGNAYALARLAVIREAAGRRKAAEELAWQAAQHGNCQALVDLAEKQDAAGDHQAAVALAQKAADHDTGTQDHLPVNRELGLRQARPHVQFDKAHQAVAWRPVVGASYAVTNTVRISWITLAGLAQAC